MAVIPVNPLTRVQRDSDAAMMVLSEAETAAAQALERRDPQLARNALDALRRAEDQHARFRDTLTVGQETAAMSPLRWSARSGLERYVDAAVHIERAIRDLRVMQVWIVAVIRDHEPIPTDLPKSLHCLSKALTTLRQELDQDTEPLRTRHVVHDAVQEAGSAVANGVGFAGGAVAAQVRGTAVDLLIAAGLVPEKVRRRCVSQRRHAAGIVANVAPDRAPTPHPGPFASPVTAASSLRPTRQPARSATSWAWLHVNGLDAVLMHSSTVDRAGWAGEAVNSSACVAGVSVRVRGFLFPADVITVAVRWYRRYGRPP